MHGLVNRSIQCFVRDTYGESHWVQIAQRMGLNSDGFEAMLTYDDALTHELVAVATRLLNKTEDILLEDVGTYLVSHPNTEAIRRLLRFGGETFAEFLLSLDDLPDRVGLAVPELSLPDLELRGGEEGQYDLQVSSGDPGFSYVLVGVLRAMADDYGALAFLDLTRSTADGSTIRISLLDSDFSEGRSFSLACPSRFGSELSQ